jgi:hypothetical protein
MTCLTFFPTGNADTTLLRLADERLVLFDFADMRNPDDRFDARCDLKLEMRREMERAGQDDFAVVCFTHLDDDHVCRASAFFWFRYADKYQGPGRVKFREMWVPAGAITEVGVEGDAQVIRAEARHRLLKGEGIKVFSRPEALRKFLEDNGLTLESRAHCIVDAGQTVPGFKKTDTGRAEFFVHAPFAWRTDDRGLVDRNQDSIVVQAAFQEGAREVLALLGSDVDHTTLTEIVLTTKKHKNEHRLRWDVLKLFHHCSYKSLGPDKGVDETEAVPEVKWLFEQQSNEGCYIVSPSWEIPAKGSDADKNDPQPPHRQAANHHRRVVVDKDGEFVVTMETPMKAKPKPFRIEITSAGAALTYISTSSSAAATSSTGRVG